MNNKWEPLSPFERKEIYKLNDPIVNLILINGWRRNELSQVLINYDGGDYAKFVPKKRNKIQKFLLTKKEKSLIIQIQSTIFSNLKKTKDNFNRKINRYFKEIADKLKLDKFFPHRLRATFGTQLNRFGVSTKIISTAMNHKSIKQTYSYIQPDQEEILEAKQLQSNLSTLDGMTIQQWREFALSKVKQLRMLENEIQKLKGGEKYEII